MNHFNEQQRNGRGRKWCFTINNYTAAEEKHLIDSVDEGTLAYVIFGRETGDNGTPHLQGYCEFPKRVRFSTVKRVLPRAHIEKTKAADPKKAIDYCKKDGDWFEKGRCTTQGKRTDLDAIRSRILEGASENDIANEHFASWCRYRKSFTYYRGLVQGPRNWKSFVHVLWGKTGVGKTRIVYDLYGAENIWVFRGKGWFDGYTGQSVALFDDFRGAESGIPIGLFLRLLDRYPLSVGTKGSFTNWVPRKIYITSNDVPGSWYPNATYETFNALTRRFNKVENIQNNIYEN